MHGSRALRSTLACRQPPRHDRGMKSRVHATYKTRYRVWNWRAYERALVRRGDVSECDGVNARHGAGQPAGLAVYAAPPAGLVVRSRTWTPHHIADSVKCLVACSRAWTTRTRAGMCRMSVDAARKKLQGRVRARQCDTTPDEPDSRQTTGSPRLPDLADRARHAAGGP